MKKKHIIIIVVVCAAVALVAIGTYVVLGIVAVNNYKQVQERAENAVSKGNATIIAATINLHNVLSDKKILVLPDTADEYNAIAKALGFDSVMEQEDYLNAIPLVEFDEDGNAECASDN